MPANYKVYVKKGYELGYEAGMDVKKARGVQQYMAKAYENVESYSQLPYYSDIGYHLSRSKDMDRAVSEYDLAVQRGILAAMKKKMKPVRKVKK